MVSPCFAGSTERARFNDQYVRASVGVLVGSAHIAIGWIALQQVNVSARVIPPVMPLAVISLARKTNARIATAITVDPILNASIPGTQPLFVAIEPEPMAPADTRSTGHTIPPHPENPLIDTKPFAQRAGLSPGVGATVVLRVEVQANSVVGQVQVEVSGGTPKVDEAAIAYVRMLKWIGGRVDNQPETLWIRWGVRFDG